MLDLPTIRSCLADAATKASTARPEITRIVLFGSLARGDATPGSDADLLLVLDHSDLTFTRPPLRYLLFFDRCGLGVDIFAYTEEELAAKTATAPRWTEEIRRGHTHFTR